MARNIVICLDGTANEPERAPSNVIRTFEIAEKSDTQLVYYDPGVGTQGARSASTRIGKTLSRVNGLALGHGIGENIEEAYRFLMNNYQGDDQIFVFGFSRGAYTARALAGLLRTVGLIRPGLDNMIPYAMKLYTRRSKEGLSEEESKAYWEPVNRFRSSFGNSDFPSSFDRSRKQIQFLGVWDTVKFVGWLNVKGQFQQARWPFTRNVSNVAVGRHALALDEKRRFYAEYRFDRDELTDDGRDLREVWFVGAHSDVGGGLSDEQPLADISLDWMLGEAESAGLRLDGRSFKRRLDIAHGDDLPPIDSTVAISENPFIWFLTGAGWRRRKVLPGDEAHHSVAHWRSMNDGYRAELA